MSTLESYRNPRYTMYNQDGLQSVHNHGFMVDPAFQKAYARGCQAAMDYRWHWRVHIGLWAASTASNLAGEFVECGVNQGFLSSAIMQFLDWDVLGKTFYLLDTFEGLDLRYVSEDDRRCHAIEKNELALKSGIYVKGAESVRKNFSEWQNIRIIEGSIPETLASVEAREVAYLHLDMNCSPPEVAALEYFWDKLVPGAVILLDDYAYRGYESQQRAIDEAIRPKGVMAAALPTGQGLVIKPPSPI